MKRLYILILFLVIILNSNNVEADHIGCGAITDQATCISQGVCAGDDSTGPDGEQRPDGIGDVLHRCQWTGSSCINLVIDGDPYAINTGPGISAIISSVCFNNSGIYNEPSCSWLTGSFVVHNRRYCDNTVTPNVLRLLPDEGGGQCLYDDPPNKNVVHIGSNSLYYPYIDSIGQRQAGFCLEYCNEGTGQVTEYDKCVGSIVVPDLDSSFCPSTVYENYCNSNNLITYTCDGNPTTPIDYTPIDQAVDGVNKVENTLDCTTIYPPIPPECNTDCGTVFNTQYNLCESRGGGSCQGTGINAECLNDDQLNLDDSQQDVQEFNAECTIIIGPSWGQSGQGIVNWSEGGDGGHLPDVGDMGSYGEYYNNVVWTDYYSGETFISSSIIDRRNWAASACGDDQDEYFIADANGGLCCNDITDVLNRNVVDNVADPLEMSGDYCAPDPSATTCGNYQLDSGETCDALYVNHLNLTIIDGNPIYNYEFRRVLGDDSSCAQGEVCDSVCSCQVVTNPTCGDGTVNQPTEDCDLPDWGWASTCQDLGFSSGTLACTAQCKYDTSGCSGSGNGEGDVTTFYGECYCPSGDECEDGIGQLDVVKILSTGPKVETQECFLAEENVPFINWISFLLAILILISFYYLKRKK